MRGGKWKCHKDSGAFEYIPSADDLIINDLKETNNKLVEENKQLKTSINDLTTLLINSGVITKDQVNSLMNKN